MGHLIPLKHKPAQRNYMTEDQAAMHTAIDSDYTAYQKGKGLEQKTIEENNKQIRNYMDFCQKPLWECTTLNFSAWSATFYSLAESTQRKYQSAVRGFEEWLMTTNYPRLLNQQFSVVVQPSATADVRIPHKTDDNTKKDTPALMPVELKCLFDYIIAEIERANRLCSKSFRPLLRDYALLYIMYCFGLRAAEVLGLTIHSFAPDPRYPDKGPFASVVVIGKGNKRRVVPSLHPDATVVIQHYFDSTRPLFSGAADTTMLFLSERREALKYGAYHYSLGKLIKGAGLAGKDITGHSLRRAFATQLHMAGVPLAVIQRYLGHQYLATTQRYLRLGDEYVDAQTANILDRIQAAEKMVPLKRDHDHA